MKKENKKQTKIYVTLLVVCHGNQLALLIENLKTSNSLIWRCMIYWLKAIGDDIDSVFWIENCFKPTFL